jgi:hypothetical protein
METMWIRVGADLLVYGSSALRAEEPYTIEKESTAVPKAYYANCVSPNSITGSIKILHIWYYVR